MWQRIFVVCVLVPLLGGCGRSDAVEPGASAVAITPLANFDLPWAMTFLPDGRLLVTEKKGALWIFATGGRPQPIRGVPNVAYGNQGGLGDVVLDPDYARNRVVYLSYADAVAPDTRGAVVARAELALDAGGGL